MSIESVMSSNHLILCCPLLLPPSIFPSIRVFSNESVLHIRWPKYWSFSFSIIPSNEYSGLTSFRIDWFDLLAVQGTLKNLLQHHGSKASILWHSVFLVVQLSHPHMTTGKSIALTRRTFKKLSVCVYIHTHTHTHIRIYVNTHTHNSPVCNIHLKSPPLSENFSAPGYKIFFFGIQFNQLKTCKLAGHASRKTLTRLKLCRG